MNASDESALGHLHDGFVAMEYFALILNRSFLVLITDNGLVTWQFAGLITDGAGQFYAPIEELLDDPEMLPGLTTFEDMMREPDTSVIPYSAITSVSFVAKRKWGMGSIPHSGILLVRLTENRKREFILLGAGRGAEIRDAISRRLGIRATGESEH